MFNDGFINIIREEIMKLIKTFISVLFSAFLLFSSTSSFAVEKLHFLIGGGAVSYTHLTLPTTHDV